MYDVNKWNKDLDIKITISKRITYLLTTLFWWQAGQNFANIVMIRKLLLLLAGVSYVYSIACPLGWAEFKGECLLFPNRRAAYIDYETYCRSRGGFLASIDNADKMNFVKQVCSVLHADRWERFYFGASDFAIEGSWRWLETGVDIGSYSNWADGHPLNNGTQNCAGLIWLGNDLKWVDMSCNDRSMYGICEMAVPSGGPSK